MKRLLREGTGYLVVGLIQLALDSAVFIGLTALGVAAAPANVIARVSGAALGFWLNGRYTFAHEGRSRVTRGAFLRFALLWLTLTVVSTVLVSAIAYQLGLRWAWVGKPLVDGTLALLGFLGARHLVYR